MDSNDQFYLKGEERFGTLSSAFYLFFERIGPMRKFHRFVASTVSARSPGSVLDIGFGTGAALGLLCRAGGNVDLYGVEPSAAMLRRASARLGKCAGEKSPALVQGSSRHIPFDRKFDVIFSSLSFHHWAEQEDSLRNVLKYLEPDGSFLAFEFGTELLKGYRKMASGHAVSTVTLEKFRKIADFSILDHGEYRVVEFRHTHRP